MPSIRLGTCRDLKYGVRTLEQTYERDGTHRRRTPTERSPTHGRAKHTHMPLVVRLTKTEW
jgi:hypothetical protein